VSVVVEGTTLILPLGDVVDLGQEKARLGKEIGRLDAELAKFAAKLGNPGFLAKAKPEIVEEQREREADTRRDRDRLKAAYERLEADVTLSADDLGRGWARGARAARRGAAGGRPVFGGVAPEPMRRVAAQSRR
jgi:hypothetical protein